MRNAILRLALLVALLRQRDPHGTPEDWRRRGLL